MKAVGEVMAIGRTFEEALGKAMRSLGERALRAWAPTASATEILDDGRLRRPGRHAPRSRSHLLHGRGAAPRLDGRARLHEAHRHRPVLRRARMARHGAPCEENLRGMQPGRAGRRRACACSSAMGSPTRRSPSSPAPTEDDRAHVPQDARRGAARSRPWTPAPPSSPARRPTTTRPTTRPRPRSAPARRARRAMILGAGPNRIGQGIEFDYCCVHASYALRDAGYETIMVNCNPETVSTDYDTSDKLYFEPLTFEDVMDIVDVETTRRRGGDAGRPNAAEACRGAAGRGRAHHGHETRGHRPGRRPRPLLAPSATSWTSRTRPPVMALHVRRGVRGGRPDRLPAARAPQLRAGRARHGHRLRRRAA